MAKEYELSTGRTVWQGEAIEAGKNLEMYKKAAAVCFMNKEDMERDGFEEGENVKVISEYGEVVVKVYPTTQEMFERHVFIPMGPWANLVVKPHTESTAMPSFKGPLKVKIEKTDEEVLPMEKLIKKYYLE